MHILIFLLVGLIAGWLAGIIMKGRGFGLVWNLIIGAAGSFVGGYIFRYFQISIGGEIIGSIIAALAGALIILVIINLVRRR
jgi:uncharacterized membrane protein YeaQ/YmgE (transglycosylase-associated protein family)